MPVISYPVNSNGHADSQVVMDPQQMRRMMPGPYPTTPRAEGMAKTPVAKQSFMRIIAALILNRGGTG